MGRISAGEVDIEGKPLAVICASGEERPALPIVLGRHCLPTSEWHRGVLLTLLSKISWDDCGACRMSVGAIVHKVVRVNLFMFELSRKLKKFQNMNLTDHYN